MYRPNDLSNSASVEAHHSHTVPKISYISSLQDSCLISEHNVCMHLAVLLLFGALFWRALLLWCAPGFVVFNPALKPALSAWLGL